MDDDEILAGCPDDTTDSFTIAELAADKSRVREQFWLLAPDRLNDYERLVLRDQLADYLSTGLDPDWFSAREVELMLELHNHLRAWLEEDHALGETLGPSFPRVT